MSRQDIQLRLQRFFTGHQDEFSTETLAEGLYFSFEAQKKSTLKIAVISLILAFIMWDQIDNLIVSIWLCIALLVRYLIGWQAKKFLRLKPAPEACIKWGHYFTLSTFVMGLVYGSAAMLFFSDELPVAIQLFILIVVLGIINTAMTVTAYWLASFYAFMFTILGMTTLTFLLQSDLNYQLLSVLTIINMLGSYSLGKSYQQSVLSSIQLRFEHAKLLEELKISKEQADDANKRKTRFLASASHDLRQPVHALELFSEALTEEKLSSKGKHTLAYLNDSVASLNELLSSLLDISRLDAGIVKAKFEAVNVSRLLQRLADNHRNQVLEKGLTLRVRCHACTVYSDATLLENTIRNLLGNAIKYTNEGGILLNCRMRKNELWIEVWDTGIGIPQSEMKFIYDEFYQINNAARDRRQGLGLGLAIVSREMRMLGHSLSLHSQESRGTVARIKLQSANTDSKEMDEPVAIKVNDRLAGKKILIIDDEEPILIATKMLVEKWGSEVETAFNMGEARALCQYFSPDVILSDFRLREDVTGIDVIEQLRLQLEHDIPAILITGDTSPDRLQQAQESGLILLHKPVKPAKLRAAINMLLNS